MPFPRALEWSEAQTAYSGIWTWIVDFIPYKDKRFARCALKITKLRNLTKSVNSKKKNNKQQQQKDAPEKKKKIRRSTKKTSIAYDCWPSHQSEILYTGRTCENKQKQSRCWSEMCECYEMIYANSHLSASQSVSARLQRSVELVVRKHWPQGDGQAAHCQGSVECVTSEEKT